MGYISKSAHSFLNVQQVKALAQAAGEHYSLFIQVLSTTGIRFGEATALRVSDVDLNGSRIRIQRAFTSVGGRLIEKSPKSHASRTVLIPAFLRDDIEHSMRHKDPTDLVFTTAEGYPIRNENFRRRVFLGAVKEAGEILGTPLPPVTVHDLRHTAASLAISSGANIKVIQRMLGHASADMTLDVYGHLYESDLDSVAQRMNQQFKSA
ncbi:site-specific integrase [Corynebacterium sanguinis]|uniref:site-specific integrase n=1 Tax=Corynebacterium sanguinis TaxID=2594913 RepID=UPI0011869EFD|nr:site-specific integrase [Corynebacterium sanguinis]MCT1412610.1 site-specific integrase [Corynebacterium sanguinis]QDR77162.1 site-specific integrase [Corynebacterium sanguinis]